ncbi:MAG: cysteine dioxygenase [Phycisphaerales bacterium]|jgi:cysteine dioxygenase
MSQANDTQTPSTPPTTPPADPAAPQAAALPTDCGTALENCPKLKKLLTYLDGLTGRAPLDELEILLNELDLTGEDLCAWKRFGVNAYKRNTIAKTEHFELLALCWRSGHATPIHDHRGSSCAFKVIEGVGCEIRFEQTECGCVAPTGNIKMQPGYVCAAEDDDIHQIVNTQGEGDELITLHLYTPALKKIGTYDAPYSAKKHAVEGSPDLYDL